MEYFDAEQKINELVAKIKVKCEHSNCSKVVIGISGGKDSAVAAALCVRALGAENVYGILMPDGEQKDISDSIEVVKALKIPNKVVNIANIKNILINTSLDTNFVDGNTFFFGNSKESEINVAPRIRMTILRYIGQCMGALLCGTGNLSERTIGYFTKDGDGSCDFNPLGNLTSLEVVEIGLAMKELPEYIVRKTPDDGLSGMSDEEKIGISYNDIHKYIRYSSCGDPDIDYKIMQKNVQTEHKRNMPEIL